MNLDKKLELAEKVLIAIVQADNRNYNWDAEGVSALSFEVADAMEAEYNKRNNTERPEVLFDVDSPKTKREVDWSRAIELVSDLGIEYAKYLLEDDDVTEFKIHSNGECGGYTGTIFADDLRRLVESHELVMEYDGLFEAKELIRVSPKLTIELRELAAAIADVESCQ